MEIVKKTDEYTIIKKRSGRFGVKNAQGRWVNADDKVKILLGESLIKASVAAPKDEPQEAAAEEAPAQEAAAEEAPAQEEAPAEETPES